MDRLLEGLAAANANIHSLTRTLDSHISTDQEVQTGLERRIRTAEKTLTGIMAVGAAFQAAGAAALTWWHK